MGKTEDILTELLGIEMELQDVGEQIKVLLNQQEMLHERQSELKALLEQNESSTSHAGDETAVSVENWSGPFEWDLQADDVRFNIFGISSYRANQREVCVVLDVPKNYCILSHKPVGTLQGNSYRSIGNH